jgi:hypothetical protein
MIPSVYEKLLAMAEKPNGSSIFDKESLTDSSEVYVTAKSYGGEEGVATKLFSESK